MSANFQDRLLTCADCRGEFIFTAGEQIFFYDKQFKNDPKRCKPCKLRRSGLAAAANGTGPAAAGISRTETRTECSACGIETTVPFKPTQGRPVLCRACFQVKGRVQAAGLAAMTPAETADALTLASSGIAGDSLTAAGALLAATSLTGAQPGSSVASAADLASLLTGSSYSGETALPSHLFGQDSVQRPREFAQAEVE